MMIGLHKLAAQNGDGLVPELYALLTRRADMLQSENVTEFPLASARQPARAVSFENTHGLEARNDNVVAFPAPRLIRRDSV
ncbi:hypothetical protein D0Y60_19525 [Shinella sp. WSJ-2]|uniref:hypothetical protein n=1 Tax=Shinella sp. WSJ-2 TaxID=2303749 RepID=UPI000E3E716C|nr:hypothetical protein [Shinella sp. WSJ-2]RFZ84005.1 hypothetical protein D0Y60_19525 [Shinella sp. WSJ-2]